MTVPPIRASGLYAQYHGDTFEAHAPGHETIALWYVGTRPPEGFQPARFRQNLYVRVTGYGELDSLVRVHALCRWTGGEGVYSVSLLLGPSSAVIRPDGWLHQRYLMDHGFSEETHGDWCKTVAITELFGHREEITDLFHPRNPEDRWDIRRDAGGESP